MDILFGKIFLDSKFLIDIAQSFIFIDNFIQFLLFFFNMILDILKFIVGMFFDSPFHFGKHLVDLPSRNNRNLELFSQADEFHFLGAVLLELSQQFLLVLRGGGGKLGFF